MLNLLGFDSLIPLECIKLILNIRFINTEFDLTLKERSSCFEGGISIEFVFQLGCGGQVGIVTIRVFAISIRSFGFEL